MHQKKEKTGGETNIADSTTFGERAFCTRCSSASNALPENISGKLYVYKLQKLA